MIKKTESSDKIALYEEVANRKKTTLSQKKTDYVDKAAFYEAMVTYKKAVKDAEDRRLNSLPSIPNYVGSCMMLICTKLSHRPEFSQYTFREELIGDAVENCVKAVNNFDPEKSANPFGYFTQIAWYAFLRRIEQESYQTYLKHKNFQNSFIMDEVDSYQEGGDHTTVRQVQQCDVIEKWETKKKAKAKATKAKKKVSIGIDRLLEDEYTE